MFKIAHRGAAGYAPENTIASFKKAIELKADMIELDVYLCQSGELIIMHDDKVDRTTNGKGYLWNKNLKEIKSLDAGNGEKVPTLKEALDFIDKKVPVNIELKGEKTAVPVSQLIDGYKKKGWKDKDFLVTSFKREEVKKFKLLKPNIKAGFCSWKMPSDYESLAEKIGLYSLSLFFDYLNKRIVSRAQKKGLKVFAWTVNKDDDIQRMKSLGVDGIFSDYPDRI